MTKFGWPFWPTLALACAVPAVAAIVIGIPVLRLRGHYFAIATLALGVAMGEIANNLPYLGAASGISLPIGPSFGYFYYLMLAALVLSVVVMWVISRSRFGYALFAIRENEQAASTLGINTAYYKTAAFAVSAILTGLAGGIYAYWTSFIDPPTVFNIVFNVDIIVMTLLGGVGTIFGPIVGAFILEGLNEVLGGTFLELHAVIFGALIVLIVLFLPGGLSSLFAGGRLNIRTFLRNFKSYKV
jgi:branched-chain amino acid transport system permease protein